MRENEFQRMSEADQVHQARQGSSFLPVMARDSHSPGNAITQQVDV
jgi:hypothetical protein